MEKDTTTPLLTGRGFLATASAVIDCKKAKIAVGEGVTRSIFLVKEINLGDEEVPYWTTLAKRESYKPQPNDEKRILSLNKYILLMMIGKARTPCIGVDANALIKEMGKLGKLVRDGGCNDDYDNEFGIEKWYC
ncbi:hypothetical protein Tco_0445279 [Tanacetum coccineum]